MPGTAAASFKSFCADTILQGREAVLMYFFSQCRLEILIPWDSFHILKTVDE
jgi:hypothetical protein